MCKFMINVDGSLADLHILSKATMILRETERELNTKLENLSKVVQLQR
jgi:hypothetical protein